MIISVLHIPRIEKPGQAFKPYHLVMCLVIRCHEGENAGLTMSSVEMDEMEENKKAIAFS